MDDCLHLFELPLLDVLAAQFVDVEQHVVLLSLFLCVPGVEQVLQVVGHERAQGLVLLAVDLLHVLHVVLVVVEVGQFELEFVDGLLLLPLRGLPRGDLRPLAVLVAAGGGVVGGVVGGGGVGLRLLEFLDLLVEFLDEGLCEGGALDEVGLDFLVQLHLDLEVLDFFLELLVLLELDGDVLGLVLDLVLVLLVLDDEEALLLFWVGGGVQLEKPLRSRLLSSTIFFLSSTMASSTL